MKNVKRIISVALCFMLCLSVLLLAGCGDDKASNFVYTEPEEFEKFETTSVAENDRYSLIWDGDNERVVLYDKIEKYEWSYVPEESLNPSYDGTNNEATVRPIVKSPIQIGYYKNSNSLSFNQANAYARSIEEEAYTIKKIDNGLEMMLYFKTLSITVPVQFILVDDGVEVSVEPERIEEGDEYSIFSVTIAPLFCSVSNKYIGNNDHYMFVPSGSGTLIYPAYTDGVGVSSVEPVYGGDENVDEAEMLTVTENVRIPVYGAVNGDKGVCAIIKDGAESALINTMEAQALTGYSYINSEFEIKGYQKAINSLFTNQVVESRLYADAYTADNVCVGFYPLYGEDASYVGMANKYRDYLTETKKLSTERSEDSLLNLKLIGGITSKKFIFGIPTQSMLTATTLQQAKTIVSEIKTETQLDKFNVNLVGFGSTGNDIGVVAGGYKINSAFGKKKDMKAMTSYCAENGINLFMNFDMIRFSSSGGGVSTTFGRADSASGSFTTKSYYTVNFRAKDATQYYLASRSKLAGVAENIKKSAANWNLKGISLDTLTSMVYSDYSDAQYYAGANTVEQFTTIINNFTGNDYKVAGSDANAYLAGLCDHIYDVPVKSSRYRNYTVDVPFYQIVFKGYVSMSATSLNLATNANDILLKSVETGSGLTYTLVGEYDTNLVSSLQNVFYGSLYYDSSIGLGVKDSLISTVKEYKEYFDLVKGATIVDHEIVVEGVNKTTFDNGISVYVNYTDYEFATEDGAVAAGGYIVVR